MKSIKGTLTEKNLLTSFAGESQARMRYTYFAKEAKREGYEQIAAIFAETAEQEKMHAKRMFQFLEGGMVEICASYPAGEIRSTMENLRAAAVGEFEEWHDLYPTFADIAEDEGFKEVQKDMTGIEHISLFLDNLDNMESVRSLHYLRHHTWL